MVALRGRIAGDNSATDPLGEGTGWWLGETESVDMVSDLLTLAGNESSLEDDFRAVGTVSDLKRTGWSRSMSSSYLGTFLERNERSEMDRDRGVGWGLTERALFLSSTRRFRDEFLRFLVFRFGLRSKDWTGILNG
jgi:hypothetical protein